MVVGPKDNERRYTLGIVYIPDKLKKNFFSYIDVIKLLVILL